MSEFKSVDRYRLQRAFAIAHKMAQNGENSVRERKIFRIIAKLIWESCSEDGPYTSRLAADIEDALSLLADNPETRI